MKKVLMFLMLFAGLLSFTSCSADDNNPDIPTTDETGTMPEGKILIVYYSFTNNVHRIVSDLQTDF